MTSNVTVPAGTLAVTVGHGTENDFVLVDDPDGRLDLTADLVRALCDRRAGLGGDGLIRLVRTTAVAEGAVCLAEDPAATWFMDYRNADGTVAEMCGNGVRVVARFAENLDRWPDGADLVLGTRAGVRRVRRLPGPDGQRWFAVDMGHWTVPGGAQARAAGHDVDVAVAGLPVARPGLRVEIGNPHTVLAVADDAELAAADLTRVPRVTPAPEAGTNVELVVPVHSETEADDGPVGRIRMRVHERGVGETRSCGTGACAAVVAVRTWLGAEAPDTWWVDVPGGTLRVRVEGERAELAGPAVLVADAVVDLSALRGTSQHLSAGQISD